MVFPLVAYCNPRSIFGMVVLFSWCLRLGPEENTIDRRVQVFEPVIRVFRAHRPLNPNPELKAPNRKPDGGSWQSMADCMVGLVFP